LSETALRPGAAIPPPGVPEPVLARLLVLVVRPPPPDAFPDA
jgi:hypothetical protein